MRFCCPCLLQTQSRPKVVNFLFSLMCWLVGGYGGVVGWFVGFSGCFWGVVGWWFFFVVVLWVFPPPRYLSLKVWKKASIFSFGILLTTDFIKLSYGLGGLSTTRQSSTMFKIATSNRCSLFTLSSAVQISVKIKSNVTSVPYVATHNSLDWRSGSLP